MAPTTVQNLASDILTLSKQPNGSNNKELISKAKELITNVQTPMDHGESMIFGMVEPAVIRTLLSLNVLQSVPREGKISLGQLAKTTGVQEALLQRLLRVVVSTGFIRMHNEAEDVSFEHTSISASYAHDFLNAVFPALYDELLSTVHLFEYYQSHSRSEPDGADAVKSNPATWIAGKEGEVTAFELVEQDPQRLKNFHVLMGMAERFRPVTGFYDYGVFASPRDEERVELVDVGGGDGSVLSKILAAYPNLDAARCVLQDRASVITLAERNEALPAAVKKQAHDFFTSQPIQGARAYHLRAITHDWSDSVVTSILANIVPAMAPDSKILIADNVVPEGGAKGLASMMDLMMLSIGGKERTRRDFERVVGDAGLVVDRVWPATGGEEVGGFAIVECRLR